MKIGLIGKTRFSKPGQFVVTGKGIPRSVGLSLQSSAIKYADYFREKGLKPKISRVVKKESLTRSTKTAKAWKKGLTG
jgi:hypothetical protein